MMMVRIGMFYGELGLLSPSTSTLCLSHRCNNSTLSHPSPLISPNYATHNHNKRLVASASSAPPVSGSGAEYFEQLVDGSKKENEGDNRHRSGRMSGSKAFS